MKNLLTWCFKTLEAEVELTPEFRPVSFNASADDGSENGYLLDSYESAVENIIEEYLACKMSQQDLVTETRIVNATNSRSPSPLDDISRYVGTPLPDTLDAVEKLEDALREKSEVLSFLYKSQIVAAIQTLPAKDWLAPNHYPPLSAAVPIKSAFKPVARVVLDHSMEVLSGGLPLEVENMAYSVARSARSDARTTSASIAVRLNQSNINARQNALSSRQIKQAEIARYKSDAKVQEKLVLAKARRKGLPKVTILLPSPCGTRVSPNSTPENSPSLKPVLA